MLTLHRLPWQVMYAVVHADQRPEIPADMPADYSTLMQSCWTSDIGVRHGPARIHHRHTHCDRRALIQAELSACMC